MKRKLSFEPKRSVHRNGAERWRIITGYRVNSSGSYTAEYLNCRDEAHAKQEQQGLLVKQAANDSLGIEAIKTSNKHGIASCVEKLAVVGATVEEATNWFLTTRFPAKGKCTATEAGKAFLAAKAKANLEASTLESYQKRVDMFVKHFGDTLINEITTEQLEDYFSTVGKEWSNNTMNPWKRFMQTLFNWFQENSYIALPHGAKNAAGRMTIPKRDLNTPKIATWEEIYDMLYWYDRHAKSVGGYKRGNTYGCLAYLLFCLFLGIRKSEAYEITWEDIDFDGRSINILIEGSKTDRRRVNELTDNVWSWLVYLKKQGATLDAKGDPQRRLFYIQRKYRESFTNRGAKVPNIVATEEKPTSNGKHEPKEKYHNIMRHSFCGYHFKLYESAGKTAKIMGNSEKKVRSDYHEVVRHKRDAQAYFSIQPPVMVELDSQQEITLEQAVDAYLCSERLANFVSEDTEQAKLWQHYNKIVKDYATTHEKMQDVWRATDWRLDNVIASECGVKIKVDTWEGS